MNTCPCCSEVLLRHARHNQIYWFCPHCWQEMPDPSLDARNSQRMMSQLTMPQLSDSVKTLAVR